MSRLQETCGFFEMNQNAPLKPNENWRSTLLDKDMIHLFFKLASLNGPIFTDDKARLDYLTTIVSGFLELLSSIDLQDYENLGVANTLKNISIMFPSSCLLSLPQDLFTSFIDHLTRLTCKMGRAAALEEALHRDDTLFLEAYERMLETWMELVGMMKDTSIEKLKPPSIEVFNSYVQCHISPPDGIRAQDEMDAKEEIDEVEEDDRERFSDQLCSIGILGRIVPEHSIPLLAKVLEDRVSRLHSQLQRIQHQVSPQDTSMDMSHLSVLYEDLHWIVLVATNVLSEEAEGETPMIPPEIMEYSISQTKSVDLHTTLKVMASPGQTVDSIPEGNLKTDYVIRLISAVFRLCEVENRAIQAKLTDMLSPQIGSTVVSFLRRWMAAYLLPDENYYAQVSHTLLTAFGRDTEAAQWTISFLLNRIISNLAIWGSEEHLMEDTMQLLVSLVDQRSKAIFVTKCELLWTLAKQEANHQPPLSLLPSKSRRKLLQALVLAGSGVTDDESREQYYQCVLQSLHDKFYSTVCKEDFTTKSQNAEVKEVIISLLESLCGVADGTRIDNLNRIYNFLMPLLQECVKLLNVYHMCEDVVPLCLELYSEVIQKQLCYLGEVRKRSTVNGEGEEEERYNDILLVMELLTNLLSKDFIDFSDPAEEGEPQSGSQISAADVVLYGLNTIIPVMDADLLKFPTLCSQYYKLIAFLAEVHPEKFVCLDHELFKSLMASVELGLSLYPLCLVFHMLLLETFNMDLLETASTALFCLICLHQEEYRELVNQLLHRQTDTTYQQRLLEAFNNLTPPTLTLTINRNSKITFMQNFDQFLINVRGFLCVR
ncbi:hypothetical protein FSP39_019964 [Pinctada imbricata]|uniref:Exportin-4 n=1 Tax=Pinctada imbricata TaxID=66713 RepID=A0AA89BW78_PINIB|nr:hypothetical protein FSP39_019964 [Pinctada imbricata]